MADAPIMIVTGGSRGIGAGIARLAGARGYDACVDNIVAAERAAAVAEEIRGHGRRAITVQADVSRLDDVERLFAETNGHLEPVGALVNNAGLTVETPVADHEVDTIRRIIDTNLLGPMLTARQGTVRQDSLEPVRIGCDRHGSEGYLGSVGQYQGVARCS